MRFTTDELEIEQSYGYNNLQASARRPDHPRRADGLRVVRGDGGRGLLPGVGGLQPATGDQNDNSGSTEEILPGNRGDRTLGQAKLTGFLPFDAKRPARTCTRATSSRTTR